MYVRGHVFDSPLAILLRCTSLQCALRLSLSVPMSPRPNSVPSKENTQVSATRPVPISQPTGTKRKRPQKNAAADEPEGVRPSKQPRRLQGQLSPAKHQLSEINLRMFNGEAMDPAADNASTLKRSSSQRSLRSMAASSDLETVRSSHTTANYRYKHLAAAHVYIHTDPPDHIQTAINSIIEADISGDRRVKLGNIAKELYEACKKTIQGAANEDDFVVLFYTALKAMSPNNTTLRAKADWREDLKPVTRQSALITNILANFNGSDQQEEADSASAPPPSKRQQQSAGQTSVDSTSDNRPLQSNAMPPPAFRPPPKKSKETAPIKTPRPDISIGTEETAVFSALSALSALSSQNLNNTETKEFLQQLEDVRVSSEQGGPAEPLLIIVPTQSASGLVFPFAVVEGKAYSTGKQVFEAQNQAAVSGASGLKIQLSLNKLVERTSSNVSPIPSKDQPPLFFSICTEGPYHELWAHYTHIEDGVRKFNMKLLKICNAVLLEGMEDFIVAVDNVLRWGSGPFLESVVERLGRVARREGA